MIMIIIIIIIIIIVIIYYFVVFLWKGNEPIGVIRWFILNQVKEVKPE